MPRRRTLRRGAAVATATVALAGCSVLGGEQDSSTDAPRPRTEAPTSTSGGADQDPAARLTELARAADLARVDFCELLEVDEVRRTLGLRRGTPLPALQRTVPGDPVAIETSAGTTSQPVAEYGCRWELRDGVVPGRAPGARAAAVTVFAPVVSPRRGVVLTRAVRAREDCEELADLPRVGVQAVTTTCGDGQLRSEGRVGDTWIACEVERQDLTAEEGPQALESQLVAWCLHALEQLDTRAG
ncbi:hypothetical protein KLP28_09915 [Nocardioidaceae bacterium]|nr:hypothetical protein KLP28_09915 [Nocardioidaceae bacterium]